MNVYIRGNNKEIIDMKMLRSRMELMEKMEEIRKQIKD